MIDIVYRKYYSNSNTRCDILMLVDKTINICTIHSIDTGRLSTTDKNDDICKGCHLSAGFTYNVLFIYRMISFH